MTWTSLHNQGRQNSLPSLLSHVRKHLIPQVYLDEVVKGKPTTYAANTWHQNKENVCNQKTRG